MDFSGENIWIIGASSGIGASLAREFTAKGANLILSARRNDELMELNAELGGRHIVIAFDVSDKEQVIKATNDILAEGNNIDRVIFMAAIYRTNDIADFDMNFADKLVNVNFLGAIYITYSILPVFTKQKYGQLALCGSIGGYAGMPGGQPYCATKAAIINFAESLYSEVEDYIDIKLINPGFVRTRITNKNKFHMPILIEPEIAAKAIAKGLGKGSFETHFPKIFTYTNKFLHSLPYFIRLFIIRKLRSRK